MTDAAETLTEREKETLRLLLVGHDAKSSVRDLAIHLYRQRPAARRPT